MGNREKYRFSFNNLFVIMNQGLINRSGFRTMKLHICNSPFALSILTDTRILEYYDNINSWLTTA